MNQVRPKRLLCALLLALGCVGLPATAAAAPVAPARVIRSGCAALAAHPSATAHPVASVYYVSGWPGVNARRGPGTRYCVITSQEYTADVVAVPNVPELWNDGHWWREVALYHGGGATANTYSWADVGWVAADYLLPATHNALCVAALCEGFETNGEGWSIRGSFPNTWDDHGCQNACRYGPIWPSVTCGRYGHAGTGDSCWLMRNGSGFGESGTLGAATADPNWFVVGFQSGHYYSLLWQYSWWLN